jgi:hypothetical protein
MSQQGILLLDKGVKIIFTKTCQSSMKRRIFENK